MIGILWLLAFLLEGEIISARVLYRRAPLVRIWLGAVIGFVMAMWLPVLAAFIMRFTVAAQWAALGVGALGTAAIWRFIKPDPHLLPVKDETPPIWAVLLVVVPLTVIGAYLQYTHNIRPVDGALNVGQSTYSDINLHLSIVTGVKDAAFPPEYVILPGTRLCYPFLMDTLSGSMYILGTDLAVSLWLPGTLMMALVFVGYACLAWRLTGRGWLMVLSVLLLFVNGGFGFADMIDQVCKDPSRFMEIFTGYYKTPTNLPDLNLRWSNILVDMMVPQRTFLAGWTVLIPVLYLVIEGSREHNRRTFVVAGILAGAMPMINTHAFLAAGLSTIGFMVCELIQRGFRKADSDGISVSRALWDWAIFGIIAIAMALPQIFTWTINQASQGGFVKLHFNWVNNDGGLIDDYLWFWIKNIGPAALFIIPALIDSKKEQRMIAVGAFSIFAVAETIVFQPLVYDNNKLYYVWYLLMLPVVMRYLQRIWEGMKRMKLRGISLLAGAFVVCGLLSGSLTIAREWISDYQLYSALEVEAMDYVDDNTPQDAVFLMGGQHNNAVSTLTGRKLVCGSDTFLYFHGLNYSQQKADAYAMLTDPAQNAALFDQYAVDYIYISNQERAQYPLDESLIASLYPLWYSHGDINIYAVSARAQAGAIG